MSHSSIALYRWPKRHPYVIEQCRSVHVGELLIYVPDPFWDAMMPCGVAHYPGLVIVPRRHGRFTRWWLLCPTCGRRRENLYVPPDVHGDHWACRVCWGLIYASQRYGRRHPLRSDRRYFTYRKRRSRQKAALKTQRQLARQRERQRGPG